jgi:hypothetical protein
LGSPVVVNCNETTLLCVLKNCIGGPHQVIAVGLANLPPPLRLDGEQKRLQLVNRILPLIGVFASKESR